MIGKYGYKLCNDWSLYPSLEPDVLVGIDKASDDPEFQGMWADVDASLEARLQGEVLQAEFMGESTFPRNDKIMWKWASHFDYELYTRGRVRGPIPHVNLDCPFNQADGYGNMGINLAKHLLSNGYSISTCDNWKIQNNWSGIPEYLVQLARAGLRQGSPVAVRLSQPDSATHTTGNFKVNWSMWEFPKFPDIWVDGANGVPLCLVPCGWNKQLWREGGVHSDVVVIPLGFDSSVFKFRQRKPKKVFRFYSDGTVLGGSDLISRWEKKFGDRQDLEWVIKFPYAVEEKSRGNITVIQERVSPEVMADLYYSADCFMYPTYAEGFGLFPLEAMACGTAVISTRLETTYSFIKPGLAIGVPFNGVPWFHNLDMDYFMDRVSEVAEHKWDLTNNIAIAGAEHAHRFWTWDNTVFKLMEVLRHATN